MDYYVTKKEVALLRARLVKLEKLVAKMLEEK